MQPLHVYIEIDGKQTPVGSIDGNSPADAEFAYFDEYVESGYPAISISLPVSDSPFTPERTKNFFEGLLPEGFARKSVANWIHASEDDYLSILKALGSECLGAVKISAGEEEAEGYEELSMKEVKALAGEGVSKSVELVTEAHLSLTGASGKVGLYYDKKSNRWFKPKGSAPSTHIVKQSHVRLSGVVANEQLSLLTASKVGIDIPKSFIINTGNGKDEDVLFATERYDRLINDDSRIVDGLAVPFRLHQEDFGQALGIPARDKYEDEGKAYLPELFQIIRSYSANPMEDQIKLWKILVFDYLLGNTDNHIKNISLIYSEDLKSIRLAPAYDMISTTVYAGNSREMAIGIGGEKNIDIISRKHFEKAAADAGFSGKMALSLFDAMADGFERAITEAAYELEEQGYGNADEIKNKVLLRGGYGHIQR